MSKTGALLAYVGLGLRPRMCKPADIPEYAEIRAALSAGDLTRVEQFLRQKRPWGQRHDLVAHSQTGPAAPRSSTQRGGCSATTPSLTTSARSLLRWPVSLDARKTRPPSDPINGSPLIYTRTRDGWTLRAVGTDRDDDGDYVFGPILRSEKKEKAE